MSEPTSKRTKFENQLDMLSSLTTVVADTGEVDAIKKYQPQDATTNPSLIYKAAQLPQYEHLVKNAVDYGLALGKDKPFEETLSITMDKLAVNFGAEIVKIVPGYVSTEVDARLSFDTAATIARARRIIGLYKDIGVDKSRILIKIAATYEGIRAAEVLQQEGISCNLTLLFALIQAVACAEAGVTLISPFVGRIMDWHKAKTGIAYTPEDDPGVKSVRSIFGYFKKFGHSTIVMGASFRSKGEVLALAGCDRLTIAPNLLEELKQCSDSFERALNAADAEDLYPGPKLPVDEVYFRTSLNDDAMATEKLAEGIRNFSADLVKLEAIIKEKLME